MCEIADVCGTEFCSDVLWSTLALKKNELSRKAPRESSFLCLMEWTVETLDVIERVEDALLLMSCSSACYLTSD